MYRGATEGFFIGDSGIFARFLRPESEEKCPLIVVFHGLPGTELNLDLAYALREAGYAVLAPNYSSAWDSLGDYRVEQVRLGRQGIHAGAFLGRTPQPGRFRKVYGAL